MTKDLNAFPCTADNNFGTIKGLTKFQYLVIEMMKANRIACPGLSSKLVAEQAIEDANLLVESFIAEDNK